jgi:hypothetical protein
MSPRVRQRLPQLACMLHIQRALALGAGLFAFGLPGGPAAIAHAEPQFSSSLTIGGGVRHGEYRPIAPLTPPAPSAPADSAPAYNRGPARAGFHLGLFADLIFLRKRASDMGFGPYVQIATTSFSSIDLGGGATWLLPVGGPAMTFNAGMYARGAAGGFAPGVSAAVFFGSKSYNFHGNYALTIGGQLEGKYGLTSDPARKHAELMLNVRLDLEVLALPVLFLREAIRGPRRD